MKPNEITDFQSLVMWLKADYPGAICLFDGFLVIMGFLYKPAYVPNLAIHAPEFPDAENVFKSRIPLDHIWILGTRQFPLKRMPNRLVQINLGHHDLPKLLSTFDKHCVDVDPMNLQEQTSEIELAYMSLLEKQIDARNRSPV